MVSMGILASEQQQAVADAMITTPKTLGLEMSVADAHHAFADTHVHMLLLTRDGVLHGTLLREDLRHDLDPRRPAIALATLAERTISPNQSLDQARHHMDRSMARRLAVINADGKLLGLLCLKQTRRGFCTKTDVVARADAQPSASVRAVAG